MCIERIYVCEGGSLSYGFYSHQYYPYEGEEGGGCIDKVLRGGVLSYGLYVHQYYP